MSKTSTVLTTLKMRNSWYHNTIKDFIAQGEIGELAIIRGNGQVR